MDGLLILGAGGFGRTVCEAARAMGAFGETAFLDDAAPAALGPLARYADAALRARFAFAYPAFGDNALRGEWLARLEAAGYRLPVLVHPRAWVSETAAVEPGAAVLALAGVGCGSTVRRGAIVNLGALVDHDCVVGVCAHLAPGVVVKAANRVPDFAKLESGTVLLRAQQP